ncbi:MAG TPA: ATP-dependent DNA helicase [Armatimonadota bacterium]|jgi:ATP-dependent DNA helicase DinG
MAEGGVQAGKMVDIFSAVVRELPGYEPRPQQLLMAERVAQALESGEHAILEAGTGCGKTMAYLLPALAAGKRAVVSTGTIALQTQLVEKDLLFIQKHYPGRFSFALAKGMGNYLCLPKYLEADRSLPLNDPNRPVLSQVSERWSGGDWNGDVGALPFKVPPGFWAQELGASWDDCTGSKCSFFEVCPARRARRAAEDADIIVANHALYFTHLAMAEALLPPHDLVIFDEAHHLEDVAIRSLAVEIPRWSTRNLLLKAERRMRGVPTDRRDALASADEALASWVSYQGWRNTRVRDAEELTELARDYLNALTALSTWIKEAPLDDFAALGESPEEAKRFAQGQKESLLMQLWGLVERWTHFADLPEEAEGWVNWLEADGGRQYFSLQSASLKVADLLREKLWPHRPAVLTSATLSVKGSFDFLQERLGLDSAVSEVIDSPFDYTTQALLYLPRGLPNPNNPEFNRAIVPVIRDLLEHTQGRAFVLFTSYRSLREVAGDLMEELPFPCKTQEELPRGALLDWFKSTPNAVLFATSSFWEGVDVPGEQLSCVIMDRLPFAHPDDPIVQATVDTLKEEGRDWFNGYTLPKAIISLKQGFGRLIRTKTDKGVVAILDSRLFTKPYGKLVVHSLPKVPRIFRTDGGQIEALLNGQGHDAPAAQEAA